MFQNYLDSLRAFCLRASWLFIGLFPSQNLSLTIHLPIMFLTFTRNWGDVASARAYISSRLSSRQKMFQRLWKSHSPLSFIIQKATDPSVLLPREKIESEFAGEQADEKQWRDFQDTLYKIRWSRRDWVRPLFLSGWSARSDPELSSCLESQPTENPAVGRWLLATGW